jgi:hypothetical protein
MNKIKSFTILELTVVMLMSTLVLGIAYNGYTIFYKQFISFKKSSSKIADISLLDRLIWTDIADCKTVVKNEQGITCKFAGNEIKYVLEEDFILRKRGTMIDSFFITVEDAEYNFRTNKAYDGQIIDELKFINVIDDQQKVFHYLKTYGADILINNQDNLNNGGN